MENSGEALDDDGSGWFEVKKVCFFGFLLPQFAPFVKYHQVFQCCISCNLNEGSE